MANTKEDYEKVFNDLLGMEIKWSKLSKEELVQIAMLFENPELLMKKLVPEPVVDEKKPRFPFLQKLREKAAVKVVDIMDDLEDPS